MKAVFVTLGCKVNQYESRILEERFAKAGIESAKNGEKSGFLYYKFLYGDSVGG